MPGLSPKLPIARDKQDGYALTKTYEEMIQQNLKNLLLTVPGERMMDPDFGVGLKTFLFEQHSYETYSEIFSKSLEQVQKYMPFLNLERMEFYGPDGIWTTDDGYITNEPQPDADPNLLQIRMFYLVVPVDTFDSLDLDFAV